MPFLRILFIVNSVVLMLSIVQGEFAMADDQPKTETYLSTTIIPFKHKNNVIEFPLYWGSFVETFSLDHITKPIIVAIHGTPGRWFHWGALASKTSLSGDFHIVSVDRPGWGDSVTPQVRLLPKFSDQSQIIGQWLQTIREKTSQPIILLGHSWGGSIVAQLMIDYPELANAGVLVAAPMDPNLSRPRWYHRLASTQLGRWVIGTTLRNSNDEMLPLAGELEKMALNLNSIHQPVAVLQGRKDRLVNWKNLEFIKREMTNAALTTYEYPSVGHMIPFKTPEMISEAIYTIYRTIENKIKTVDASDR